MLNLRILVVVTLCLSGLVLTPESKAADKKKVQVTSLQAQNNLLTKIAVPEFSTLADLLDYQANALPSEQKNVLMAFMQFSTKQDIKLLSIQEQVDYTLALADVHIGLGDYSSALSVIGNIDASLKQQTSQGDDNDAYNSVAAIQNNIAVLDKKAHIYQRQKNIFATIQTLTDSYDLAIEHDLSRASILSALSIAQSYIDVDDTSNAQDWQQQALELLDEQDELGVLIEASILLAKQQEQMSEHLSATRTLVKVIDIASENNYDSVESSLRIQLSHNFMRAEQYINAEQELEKAYKLAVKTRNQQQQLIAIIDLMNVYALQNKFDDANSLLKAAERLQRFLITAKQKRKFAIVKAKVLTGLSQYSKALSTLQSIDSSDINDNTAKQILTNETLTLSAPLLVLTEQKELAVQVYNEFLKNKLLAQEQHTDIKLDYIMASYRHDVAKIKQLGSDNAKNNIELKKQNSVLKETIFSLKIWMLLLIVLFLIAAYYLYKYLQPKQTEHLFTDPISGAHNHSYFVKHVNLLIKNKVPFSLVMFDIDNMRRINQKLGHELGDKLFAEIVNRLDIRLGSNKLLVRLAGDQFIVIAKNFTLNQAFALAEILRKELNSNKFNVDNLSISISASFGVICHSKEMTIDSMKDDVIKVLKKAKSKGGNITQVVGFC